MFLPRSRWLIFLVAMLSTAAAPASGLDWGAETQLSKPGVIAETGFNHGALTEDSAGRLTAAWAEQDGPGNNFRIYSRSRPANATWDPATLAVDFDSTYAAVGLGAKFPAMVTLPGDTLLLVWHDYRVDGINNAELFSKRRAPAGDWGGAAAETRLTTSAHPESGGDNSYLPNLTLDPSGTAHVAWYDYRFDGNNAEILYKSRAGNAWDTTSGDGPDENISANAGDSNFPALAAGPDGSLHALWRDNTGGGFTLRYLRRDPLNGWVEPAVLSPAGTAAAGATVTVADDGTVVAVWTDARDGQSAVYLREYTGAWGPSRRISPINVAAENPAVAITADGRVHVVWEDTRVSVFNRELYTQNASLGSAWDSTGASDTRLTNATGKSSRPSLLARPGGGLALLWQDARNGEDAVFFREATAGVTGLDPPALPLVDLWPNPFQAALRVDRLPHWTREVAVVDIRGRRVAQWRSEGAFFWDGRSPNGKPVPPGVYLILARGENRLWRTLGKALRLP